MSYTKGQFLDAAFNEPGLSPYVYSLTPEQRQQALQTLDAMIAAWYRQGIQLGYPLPTNPEDSDPGQRSNVPDGDNEAVIYNLALRLCARFGKAPAVETKDFAKQGYDALLLRAVQPLDIQLAAGMPSGAGNRRRTWLNQDFLPLPEDQVTTPPAESAIFGNGT